MCTWPLTQSANERWSNVSNHYCSFTIYMTTKFYCKFIGAPRCNPKWYRQSPRPLPLCGLPEWWHGHKTNQTRMDDLHRPHISLNIIQIITDLSYSSVLPHCKETSNNQQVDHGLVDVATLVEETVCLPDSCEGMAMWLWDVHKFKDIGMAARNVGGGDHPILVWVMFMPVPSLYPWWQNSQRPGWSNPLHFHRQSVLQSPPNWTDWVVLLVFLLSALAISPFSSSLPPVLLNSALLAQGTTFQYSFHNSPSPIKAEHKRHDLRMDTIE